MPAILVRTPFQNSNTKKEIHSLYECTYGCKHLWISSKDSFTAKCPNCANIHAKVLANYVHPALTFKKMIVVTFAKELFYNYGSSTYGNYKKDSLLDTLEANGFAPTKTGQTEIILENELKEYVLFKFSRKRKTTEMYIGLHCSDDLLFPKLIECAKVDKAAKAAEPAPKPKPKIASMKDARGNDVTVGCWVCAWGTKSLSFGRVTAIEKFKENSWHTDDQMLIGAKIQKGKIVLPYKTSEQIFLLTPEQSLLMALEQ